MLAPILTFNHQCREELVDNRTELTLMSKWCPITIISSGPFSSGNGKSHPGSLMKIGTVCNTYCLPNWLTSGIICCRQYMPPLHPTFLRHTRHSSRKLLDGELDGVWQTLRFQDSKTHYSRRTMTCILAFLLSSGSFWPCHRRRSDVNGHLVEWNA